MEFAHGMIAGFAIAVTGFLGGFFGSQRLRR